jgi:hypothetical protein
MFMRVNSKCAHRLRPPSKVTGLSVDAQQQLEARTLNRAAPRKDVLDRLTA